MGLNAVVFKNPIDVKDQFGIEFDVDEETGESYLEDWEYEQTLGLPPQYSRAYDDWLGSWFDIGAIKRELSKSGLCEGTQWLCEIVKGSPIVNDLIVPIEAVPMLKHEINLVVQERLKDPEPFVSEYLEKLLKLCDAAIQESNPIVFT